MPDGLVQRVSVPANHVRRREVGMPDGLVQHVSVPANRVRRREGSGCLTVLYSV